MVFKNFKKTLLSFIILVTIFLSDRLSKLYILNLAESAQEVDKYINSFLNIYLTWNTGVGFGLLSLEQNIFYNIITCVIILINIVIIVMIIKYKDFRSYLLLIVLGGSLGNLFDRIYYRAVPDFIDLHYNNLHWFIFNVADIFITIGVLSLVVFELLINNKTKS
jgi:signal peptidase II